MRLLALRTVPVLLGAASVSDPQEEGVFVLNSSLDFIRARLETCSSGATGSLARTLSSHA